MLFTEYPITDFKLRGSKINFYTRGDARLTFKMAVIPLEGNTLPKLNLSTTTGGSTKETVLEKYASPEYVEFVLNGDSSVELKW
jgi:hypothetical protein